jgi:hypothetical protein
MSNISFSTLDSNSTVIPQFQNGRVINLTGTPVKDFNMFTANNNQNDSFKSDALRHIQSQTKLSLVFFSEANMNRLQDMIRYNVWIKSDKQFVIGRQSNIDLEIVMRAIYLQHAKNLDCKIGEQVQDLDNLVVNFCVPKIINEVIQYNGYLRQIEYLPIPEDRPVNLSSKGTRTLRSVTTTF